MRYSTHQITEADKAAVVAVMVSDWLTQGPAVERFEAALCEYTGARYAVVVNSGTAALHLCYEALARRMGRSLVLTSPLSFVATANAALYAGHDIAFSDVDRDTGALLPPIRRAPVITPVHYAGHAVDLRGFDAVLIEDACHALGAVDYDGCSRVGSCAHSLATAFSFHPVKPMTTGEGGAVTTNDAAFADLVRLLRSHGRRGAEMVDLGFNYRMPDILAALGTSQVDTLDERRVKRLHLVMEYRRLLPEYGLPLGDGTDAWHLYPIRIKGGKRDSVLAKLRAQGIEATVHYPAIHLQPYYRRRYGFGEGMYLEAEAWAAEELSLPLHAGMTSEDVRVVVNALRSALG